MNTGGSSHMKGHDAAAPRNHQQMMLDAYKKSLWVHFTAMSLGAWLLASPFSFGYASPSLAWSDAVSGSLIAVLAALSVNPARGWARWANCFVGIWLLFAPLVFRAPTAVMYVNDTLIGALVIACSILISGMPGMSMEAMMSGPDLPPGWTYNPSTWLQRAPIIGLALFSFFLSRHLAAFQLGYTDSAWDPFFGDGTRRVLTSQVSKAWPISDAGLGALSYLIEALSGFMGDQRRWRTMPWMVLMFGVLVVPLGITSIVLVIMQPVVVGAWCTLCLVTALAMLIMIPLAVDEVVAMGQFLARVRHEGKPFWKTFWTGGTVDEPGEDHRTPRFPARASEAVPAMAWGTTAPWSLLVPAALGVWQMASPAFFGSAGAAAASNELTGAIVTTTAVLAMAEVTRSARFLNIIAGFWIAVAPWILSGATPSARWSDVAAGAAVLLLSLPRGAVKERYGTWDRFVF